MYQISDLERAKWWGDLFVIAVNDVIYFVGYEFAQEHNWSEGSIRKAIRNENENRQKRYMGI